MERNKTHKRFLWKKYSVKMKWYQVFFADKSFRIWRFRLVWWNYGQTFRLQYHTLGQECYSICFNLKGLYRNYYKLIYVDIR